MILVDFVINKNDTFFPTVTILTTTLMDLKKKKYGIRFWIYTQSQRENTSCIVFYRVIKLMSYYVTITYPLVN